MCVFLLMENSLNLYIVMRQIQGIIIGLIMVGMMSCNKGTSAREPVHDILVSVNDSSLRLQDVLNMIPSGLSEEDSLALFHNIVDTWVENNVLEEVAKENVYDIEKINNMAASYRNRLIIDEYIRRIEKRRNAKVKDQDIKDYYDVHSEELIIREPIIKGLYLKISDDDESLNEVRRWMQTATDASVDNIEKFGLKHASQYEYFINKWISWSEVADQIPYRFYDADAFLQRTRDFETEYDGSVYLLHISDYLPSGSKMPIEYASSKIAEIISAQKSREYRDNIRKSIYQQSIKSGKLVPGLYDPVRREISSN